MEYAVVVMIHHYQKCIKKHGKFCTAFLSGFICPLHSSEETITHKLLDHIHLGVLCSVPLTETI